MRTYESVLRDIVGVARANERRGQSTSGALVPGNQLTECVTITAHCRRNQRVVGGATVTVRINHGPGGPSITTSATRPHPSTIVDRPSSPAR